MKEWKVTDKPVSWLAVNPGIPIYECSPDPRYNRGTIVLIEKSEYLAKCKEVEELKLDLKNSHSRIDTYLDQKAALQSKVTDLEAKVKAYEAALWDIRRCQFNDIGSWLVDRAAQALKEQAGEKGEES